MSGFNRDIQRIFHYLSELQSADRGVFEALVSGDQEPSSLQALIAQSGLEADGPISLAMARRLYMLKEEGLLSLLKERGFEAASLEAIRSRVRQGVMAFYEARFEALIAWIESEGLLSPFYRAVLVGMHRIGLGFNQLHPRWLLAITQSHTYLEASTSDAESVQDFLLRHHLYDPDASGQRAERCYTVLDTTGRILSHQEAFGPEVGTIATQIKALIATLEDLQDEVLGEKKPWMGYLQSLYDALCECDRARLFGRWVAVDEAWMAITGPIQPGHPMEYYEDRYRCAVAPEWDVRLQNPESTIGSRKESIWQMAEGFFERAGVSEGAGAMTQARRSLDRCHLFPARPLLFYGALMDGLFSAQVVPNDESVSKTHGKKIFAFGEHVLSSARMKPPMALEREIFEPDFLASYRNHLYGSDERWMVIYDIETVGHELGHLLWVDEGSEAAMNTSGAFKLIEEFKATTGGLMGFFGSQEAQDSALMQEVVITHLKRSVELIGWRESSEVAAYYHEALIHLGGFFQSGLCRFEKGRLRVDLDRSAALVSWYDETWLALAQCYLLKRDARTFLERFVRGGLPVDPATADFVQHYWDRYRAIGQEIDRGDGDGR